MAKKFNVMIIEQIPNSSFLCMICMTIYGGVFQQKNKKIARNEILDLDECLGKKYRKKHIPLLLNRCSNRARFFWGILYNTNLSHLIK